MLKKNWNIEDFIENESFVNWAKNSNAEDVAFWEKWLQENPNYKDLAEDAKWMIIGIPFVKPKDSKEDIQDGFAKLSASLNLTDNPVQPLWKSQSWLKWAAVIAVLVACGIVLTQFIQKPNVYPIIVETTFDETKEVMLPDNSTITLNANSRLIYASNYLKSDIRELSLEGVAYFDIQSQPEGKKLQVKSQGLITEVIGTSFNIQGHDNIAIVSLDEGKVNLIKENGPEQLLTPGNTAWYSSEEKKFIILDKDTRYWSSWKNDIWALDSETQLIDILKRITFRYGLSWEVDDKTLLDKKISGDISIESREVLINSLETVLDREISVDEEEKVIQIK